MKDLPTPNVRRQGTGTPVICLHSSLSSSKQFQPIIDAAGDRFEFLAFDLYGYGQSPDWKTNGMLTLEDEVDFIAPVVETLDRPFHIVGHSYGGCVTLSLALRYREKVKSVVVYEPVLFSLLFDSVPSRPGSDEIWRVQAEVQRYVLMNRNEDAAHLFVDYWSGKGVWESFPEFRQQNLAEKMVKVVADFEATLTNRLALRDYSSITQPSLMLHGGRSPMSTRQILSLLCEAIPNARCEGFEKLGHMGPVTNPELVDPIVIDFLTAH
jgi:pimeloyl-ACP methyl ester carboxylesterase